MPWSDGSFDDEVRRFFAENSFASLLDVGAGAGKYGRMARAIQPSAKVDAIEVVSDYISKFGLESVYDQVFCMPVEEFIEEHVEYEVDVCVVGDCLEHLRKSAGLDVLHFMIYRVRWLLAVFPKRYRQGPWDGHPSEAHRSVWGQSDFSEFEHDYFRRGNSRLVIARGFIE